MRAWSVHKCNCNIWTLNNRSWIKEKKCKFKYGTLVSFLLKYFMGFKNVATTMCAGVEMTQCEKKQERHQFICSPAWNCLSTKKEKKKLAKRIPSLMALSVSGNAHMADVRFTVLDIKIKTVKTLEASSSWELAFVKSMDISKTCSLRGLVSSLSIQGWCVCLIMWTLR